MSSEERTRLLAKLKDDGLTLGECIKVLAVAEDDPFVRKARQLVAGGDDVVIDEATTTSVGEDGAWVLCWLWVSNEEAGIDSRSALCGDPRMSNSDKFVAPLAAADALDGPKQASLFMQELLDAVETLAGIAEEHGARSLADLMYLQQAILSGGSIDYYPDESKVLDIARRLPSGEQWLKFIEVGAMAQDASS